jgi:putative DNA primase/helicase
MIGARPTFGDRTVQAMATPDLAAIVSRLGGDLYQGGTAALVPAPGHSRRDRSLSLRVVDGGRRLLWHAFTEAKAADVWAYLGLERGFIREETPAEQRRRQEAERRERARKLGFCGDLWRETVAASGTAVEAYLRGRGIKGPIPPTLRFHGAAPTSYPWNAPEGGQVRTFPAMVAIATAEDGKSAAGLHVTFLASDGSGKAALRSPRRMFGDLSGAVVQLAPCPEGEALAVAEGIETALAYRDLTGVPTWAALSTSGLRRFIPPHGLRRLIVAADCDDGGEGLAAARVCAERATRRCDVSLDPAPEGLDWADVLRGKIQ